MMLVSGSDVDDARQGDVDDARQSDVDHARKGAESVTASLRAISYTGTDTLSNQLHHTG